MPYNLQVIRAGEFIRLGAHGRPDFAASKRVLADLASAMIARGLDRALLDVRDVAPSSLTTTELFTLATTFQECGFQAAHRLAVLHQPNRIARADFFAMCAVQRGWNVCAFDTFEDAFDWLAAEEVLAPKCPPACDGPLPQPPA